MPLDEPITTPQIDYILNLCTDLGIYDQRASYFKEYTGEPDLQKFDKRKASTMIDLLKKWKRENKVLPKTGNMFEEGF
jgi:hypothetical protein